MAVIVVDAPSNDIDVLRPVMPAVLEALAGARPGVVTHVPRPGSAAHPVGVLVKKGDMVWDEPQAWTPCM